MVDPVSSRRIVRFGVFEVDLQTGELRKNGLKLKLQEQPFQILALLLERPGEVVTREELRQKLWSNDTFVDFDHGLNIAINKIRQALADSPENSRFIETLARRGYRFIAPIGEVSRRSRPQEALSEVASHDSTLQKPEPVTTSDTARSSWIYSPRNPKTIALLMVLLLAGPATYWFWKAILARKDARTDQTLIPSTGGVSSIMVLPFVNISPDKDQEYFSDGITEELINALTKIDGLHVVARTSAFQFKGKAYDIRKIGQQLNVDTVLEGSVRKAGDRLRITVQLNKVTDGYLLWAGSYDRELQDILAIQEEIARSVVHSLQIKLASKENRMLAKRYTEDIEAYNLYLMGRFFSNKRTQEGLQKSLHHFEQATAKDPNYAPAFAGMAESYYLLGLLVLSPRETMPKAKAAAMTALAIDPNLAEAYAPLGRIRAEYDWNWSMAEQDFKRAIELNPAYSTARHWYATYLTFMGRFDEALAEIQRAQQLDPLSLMINAQVGWVFFQRRQYDQAIEQLQKTIAMDSSFYFGHFILGRTYTHKGNFAQAVMEFDRAWQLEKNPFILGYLGHANALSGNRREAERLLTELQQLKKQRYVRATSLANIYIGLQDKNQAFAWLEKAREEGSGTLIMLKVDPMFDSLRSDARFALLLRKIGLGT